MKTVTLGKYFDFKNGLNADKSAYGSGLPFVNVMDIFNNDILSADDIKGVVEVPEKLVDAYKLKKGDILFNRTSEIPNEIAFSAVYVDTKPAVFGGFVIRAREKEENFSLLYKKYFFQTEGFRRQAIRYSQGAVRGNIGQVDLAKIKIPLPPLPTQRRIAAILQTWDRAIQLAEQQLADLQERKRGLMQLLLTGKKRLPEFEGKEEWREVRAKKLFTPISDKGFGDLPVLSVLQEGGVVLRDSIERRISFDKSTTGTYKRVKPGDFIISLRSFQGGIEMSEIEGLVSPAYTVMRTTDKALDAFFTYYLKTDNFIRRLDSVIYGIRDGKSISYNDFSFLKISIPSISEQKAIVKILDRESVLETNLTEELSSLRLQKRGLMQRLLEGEVEVAAGMDEILGL
jgi:type I restriction enzyme S subunit